MADRKDDYDKPSVPPSTPPTVAQDTQPREAREYAQDDGDSTEGGSGTGPRNANELAAETGDELEAVEANRAMSEKLTKRDKRDGAGEEELMDMPPD